MPLSTRIIFIEGKNENLLLRIYRIVFLTFTRLRSTSYNLRAKNGGGGVIGRKSVKGGKKGHLVAISWYYLHLPGEMRCIGRCLYSEGRSERGQVSFPPLTLFPRIHVTYRFTFL